jgi:hypothetical protein
MEMYGGIEVQLHAILTSVLDGGEWSASRPGRFIRVERAPGTHSTGIWVGPRAGLLLYGFELTKIVTCRYDDHRHCLGGGGVPGLIH